MPTPVLVACLVVGVLLILVVAALYDRRTGSTRPRWTLPLLFLGIGASAFGSAGLKKGSLGWGYALWVVAAALALGVGGLIRRSRTRRQDGVGPPAGRRDADAGERKPCNSRVLEQRRS